MLGKMRAVGIPLLTSLALSACAGREGASSRGGGIPWWGWLLIVLAAICLAILIWWYLGRRRAASAGARHMAVPAAEAAAPAAPPQPRGEMATPAPAEIPPSAESEPMEPDDLKVIEGIGPKVQSILNAAGIATFAQLASSQVSVLEELLEQAGLRMMDPASWPEQAGLAAAGKWDELTDLQDGLKGGR